ncbi:MAG: hypothetical protein ACP5I4_05965 [Oceanipulchritudo sp.]
MKKTSLLPFVHFAVTGAAFCQSPVMISGWDFSQYFGDGITSTDGVNYALTLPANYSDLDPNGLGAESAARGTLYYNGEMGSTNLDPATEFLPTSLNLQNNTDPGSFGYPFNAAGSYTILTGEGQTYVQDLSVTVRSASGTGSIVFAATPGSAYRDWEFAFSGRATESGTVDFSIHFSTDGSAYQLVDTGVLTDTDSLFQFSVPGNAANEAFWRIEFSGITPLFTPVLDNVSILATAGGVSNPSYWAASPLETGGWRYSGEGYPEEPGIGWIHDLGWPHVYALGLARPGDGEWILVLPGGDRNGFHAYNIDGGYWIFGDSSLGWYYSYEAADPGWKPFNL